ncbi:MAG TPA: GGDEF domain-containing protein [Gemmataceae bacterium]|nr:GGDEF domain-containing protein [Gemmataceae bacterium]
MQSDHEASVVGLTVQWGGIAIVTLLSFLMAQSVRRRFVDYWTLGWACLSLSLTSLLIAVSLPEPPKIFYMVYFFAEYAFAYLFVAGCRNHAHGAHVSRRDAWALVPAVLLAVGLPYFSDRFNVLLAPHAAVLAGCWLVAYRVVRTVRSKDQRGAGTRIVSLALVMLTVDFVQYVAVYTYGGFTGQPMPFAYLKYAPLYDLLIEVLLAFGTVILLMESVCRQLEGENHELTAASVQLQALAEKDPLSEALNRYAFYSFLQKSANFPHATVGGCVALVDVDDFKSINDTLGHSVGDAAIRAVARSIRSVIRADDLLFRWGGDEFLILLVGLGETEARLRLTELNSALLQTSLGDTDEPIDLCVSYGVATFREPASLERTIELADREMYNHKQSRKAKGAPVGVVANGGTVS